MKNYRNNGKKLAVIPCFIMAAYACAENRDLSEEKIYKYRPKVEESSFFLREEFFFWKTVENNTDFAAYTLPASQTSIGIGLNGPIEQMSFIPSFGFRLGAGYRFKPEFWEIELQYTRFCPHGTNRVNPREGYRVVSTNSLVTVDTINNAYGHISLEENLGDLTLARRFLVSPYLLLKLDMALSGAWLHQNFTSQYFDADQASLALIKQEWKFQGGGLSVGLGMDWYIGKGFSLIGKASASMYFGSYRNIFFQQEPVSGVDSVVGDAIFFDHRIVPKLQILLGPSYGRMFGHIGFNVYAAWELNNFWNLHEMHLSDLTSNYANTRSSRFFSGILGMQGLTCGFVLDF